MTELSQRFLEYHSMNPQVFKLFQDFAFQLINAGKKKLSAALIFERIRWEMTLVTRGGDFKMNNNYRADYARLFMEHQPHLGDVFSTRTRKTFDLKEV